MDERQNKVKQILTNYRRDPHRLLPILQEVQEVYSYLPEDVMEFIAHELGITPGQVFGVATFYAHFTLEPKGKFVIKVCDGTACHVRKSSAIIKTLREELKIAEGKRTSEDGLFTLEIVACLGTCMLAPVIMVGEEVYGSMTRDKVVEVLAKYRAEEGAEAENE